MTPEERQLLEETHEMVEENAKMLKSIQRAGHISLLFRVIYWGAIIAASLGAYYLIQPYINTLKDVYSNIGGF